MREVALFASPQSVDSPDSLTSASVADSWSNREGSSVPRAAQAYTEDDLWPTHALHTERMRVSNAKAIEEDSPRTQHTHHTERTHHTQRTHHTERTERTAPLQRSHTKSADPHRGRGRARSARGREDPAPAMSVSDGTQPTAHSTATRGSVHSGATPQLVTVGSLVRLQFLEDRKDLNWREGTVLQRSAERLRVRVGDEEVVVGVDKVEVIAAFERHEPLQTSYEHHKAALFHAMLTRRAKGDAQLYNIFAEINSALSWRGIQHAFGEDYPEYKGGSLQRALKDELTGRDYDRCRRIMRQKGIALQEDSRSTSPKRGDGSDAMVTLCEQCGHSVSMPFCGLTGGRHHASPRAPRSTVQGGFRALLISCEYPNSGRELKQRGATAAALRKLFAKKGLPGRVLMLSDAAGAAASQHRPTYLNIMKGIRWLAEDASPNDSLFFFYSGHANFEQGGGIVPSDFLQAGCLAPDQVMHSLTSTLPKRCGLTMVLDCPGGERFCERIPFQLQMARSSCVRVVEMDACERPQADVVVIGYSSTNLATMTEPLIAPCLLKLLGQSFNPTFVSVFQAISDTVLHHQGLMPEVRVSWQLSPREERFVIGDAVVE